MLGAFVAAHIATTVAKNSKGAIMKISTLLRKLPVFMVICALGLTASSAFSEGKGKANAKGKERPRRMGNMVVKRANCLTV